MGRDGELEEEGGLGGEAVVLDAEPHVATAGPKDRADHDGLGRPRGGHRLGEWGRDAIGLHLGVLLSSWARFLVGLRLGVSQRGANAVVGGGDGSGGGGVAGEGRGGGGVAGENKAAEGVNLGHRQGWALDRVSEKLVDFPGSDSRS